MRLTHTTRSRLARKFFARKTLRHLIFTSFILVTNFSLYANASQDLLSAARADNHKKALIALRAGANTEARDFMGNTPLIICAENGHYETFKLLIEYGALKEATDFMRRNAIEIVNQTLETTLEPPNKVKKINEGREKIRLFMKNYRER